MCKRLCCWLLTFLIRHRMLSEYNFNYLLCVYRFFFSLIILPFLLIIVFVFLSPWHNDDWGGRWSLGRRSLGRREDVLVCRAPWVVTASSGPQPSSIFIFIFFGGGWGPETSVTARQSFVGQWHARKRPRSRMILRRRRRSTRRRREGGGRCWCGGGECQQGRDEEGMCKSLCWLLIRCFVFYLPHMMTTGRKEKPWQEKPQQEKGCPCLPSSLSGHCQFRPCQESAEEEEEEDTTYYFTFFDSLLCNNYFLLCNHFDYFLLYNYFLF